MQQLHSPEKFSKKALKYRFFLWPHIISITHFCVLLQKFCELMQSFSGECKNTEFFFPISNFFPITMLSCWETKAAFTMSVQMRLFVYQIVIWLSTLFIAAVQLFRSDCVFCGALSFSEISGLDSMAWCCFDNAYTKKQHQHWGVLQYWCCLTTWCVVMVLYYCV